MDPIGFSKKKASELMQREGVDVLIASSPENVFYTSGLPVGYSETNPILYVLSSEYPSIVVISRDGEEALIMWQLFMSADKASWVRNVNGVFSRDEALQRLTSLVEQTGLPQGGTIGIESLMPYYQSYWLSNAFPGAKIRVSDDIFIDMRLVKTNEEIRRIKEATRITEKAIGSLINFSEEGVTDSDLARVAKMKVVEEGGTGLDHLNIGIGDSDPRYPVTGVKVKKGDLVRFDIGAIYGGYCSDVSRHVVVGTATRGAETASNLMIEVQQACADKVESEMEASEAIEAAEHAYKKRGGEGFFFTTIHSIGVLMDEYCFYDTMLGPSSKPFEKNMVISIECLTPFPPQGFVGIEDIYLVKQSGCERISTLESKIYYAIKGGKAKAKSSKA